VAYSGGWVELRSRRGAASRRSHGGAHEPDRLDL